MKNQSTILSRRTLRSSLGAGAALMSLLGVAACGGDDAAEGTELPAAGEVRVDSSGDVEANAKPIAFTVAHEQGQEVTQELSMRIGMDVSGGGQSLEEEIGVTMTMAMKVIEVSAGESTMEMTFESIDVDAPGANESDIEELTDLAGTTVVGTFDEQGMPVGEVEVKGGGSLPAELQDSLDQATNQVVFPDEPIGVGARWTVRDEVDASGTPIDVATTYELVEYSADEYVLDVTQDQPVTTDIDGTEIDGTVTAEGEIRGDPDNPLMMEMTYNQTSDFEMEADGQSGSMEMTLDLDISTR